METIVEKCKEMKRLWYCRVLKQRSFARTSTLFLGHSYYYLAAVRAAVSGEGGGGKGVGGEGGGIEGGDRLLPACTGKRKAATTSQGSKFGEPSADTL